MISEESVVHEEGRLIETFEDLSLDPHSFQHEDHVRLGFAYLQRFELLETMSRYREQQTEAARACGANAWQAFWHVEFPQIRVGVSIMPISTLGWSSHAGRPGGRRSV